MKILLVVLCLIPAFLQAQNPAQSPVVVQDAFGGQIFGYGIDANGTEGVLSESLLQPNGDLLVAVETFDQTTGAIVKVVSKIMNTQDDFVTWGVFGAHIGLVEEEQVQGLFVVQRTFGTLKPLESNVFTAKWTPPVDGATQVLEDVEGSQSSPSVAGQVSPYACCSRFVFGSNLATNVSGPAIQLVDPLFTGGVPPVLAFDNVTNQAVLAQSQGAPFTVPHINLVDLTTGGITDFGGAGFGFVNGIAVDSATGIACTTTETDNRAQFYNLATESVFQVELPLIGKYSAANVVADTTHKLFLIAHPVPFSLGQIHVYTEDGDLVESITGIVMGPGGVIMAINPGKRIGFTQVPGANQASSALQSFNY